MFSQSKHLVLFLLEELQVKINCNLNWNVTCKCIPNNKCESSKKKTWLSQYLYCLTQWQEQTKDKNGEEDLRAQVEPDVRLHSRPSKGFPKPHAGADYMGPTQVTRRGQRLYGRGTTHTQTIKCFFPLMWHLGCESGSRWSPLWFSHKWSLFMWKSTKYYVFIDDFIYLFLMNHVQYQTWTLPFNAKS